MDYVKVFKKYGLKKHSSSTRQKRVYVKEGKIVTMTFNVECKNDKAQRISNSMFVNNSECRLESLNELKYFLKIESFIEKELAEAMPQRIIDIKTHNNINAMQVEHYRHLFD